MDLQPGDPAPPFCLAADDGRELALEDFRGRTLVLYFYPKDDTPGCTTEAQEFRDAVGELAAAGATVVGVSPDDVASHRAFKAKHALPFPLLSDPDHAVAAAYGAWGPKTLYGRAYEGVIRSTFVVGPDGRLVRAYRNVRPAGHCARVLADLRPAR